MRVETVGGSVPDTDAGAAEAARRPARPPVKIVIPAHDEAAVVGRCLSALLESAGPAEFDVVVVSNGSTDDTSAQARAAGVRLDRPITAIDIPTASKIAALRAAEEILADFPDAIRIYLDADVILTTDAARALADALQTGEPRLALARLEIDTADSSSVVKRYYRAWTALPYVQRQVAGSGVLAMNGAGAARVGPLPEVINDDGYIARRFDADQRIFVDASFLAFAAHSASALIRRRARIVNGNRQLDALVPGVPAAPGSANTSGNSFGQLRSAVRDGSVDAGSALVFVAVTIAARVLASWRRLTGSAARWSSDRTTRQSPS
jgi:hypothetical protein